MTSPAGRKPKADVASDPAAIGLRDMIQQAIGAYELAVATQARIAAQAQYRQQQGLAELDTQESTAATQREQRQHDQQSTATAEAERVRALASLADDLTESASGLLERAALAYVRGFGPGSADVKPHLADDEQVAAAFTAAQMAGVDLRAAMLRLAGEHLRGRDWPRARQVLAPLLTGPPGDLLEAATATFRTAYLEEAAAELDNGDPGKAQADAQWWLSSHQGDADFAALLMAATDAIREAALRQGREDLANGAVERARAQAEVWLRSHEHDEGFKELLVDATITLAEQALTAGDHARVAGVIAIAVQQAGAGHPELRKVLRSHPAIAWRTGQVRLLREFGGHSQPVRDVAFTPGGSRLVSVDGTEAKTWDITTAGSGQLVRTVALPGVCGLTPDGALALSRNGELRRTDDGSFAAQVGTIASHAFSHDGTLLANAARNKPYTVMKDRDGYGQVGGPNKGLLDDPEQLQLILNQVAPRAYPLPSDYLSATSPKTEGGIGPWTMVPNDLQ